MRPCKDLWLLGTTCCTLLLAPRSAWADACFHDDHTKTLEGTTPVFVHGRSTPVRFFLPTVIIDLRGGSPLTEGERTRYIAAAQQWARSLNEATNGQHQIGQVRFKVVSSFDFNMNQGTFDVYWPRGANPQNIPSVTQPLDMDMDGVDDNFKKERFIKMFDEPIRVRNRPVWQDDPQGFQRFRVCEGGLTEFDEPDLDASRNTCRDSNDTLLLESGETWGQILAHEMFHRWFCLQDEALFSQCFFAAGFEETDNAGLVTCLNDAEMSSIMAGSKFPHLCSNDTHMLAQCYPENVPVDPMDPPERQPTEAGRTAEQLRMDGACQHAVSNLDHRQSCTTRVPMWEQVIEAWPELMEVYGAGQPYALPAPEVTFPVHPEWPEFTVFEDESEGAVFDDASLPTMHLATSVEPGCSRSTRSLRACVTMPPCRRPSTPRVCSRTSPRACPQAKPICAVRWSRHNRCSRTPMRATAACCS